MPNANYFELLGIPPAFEIDPKSLESAYFAQQRLTHPDRFVKKSPEERQQALLRSVEVNKAYDTLKKPLLRAQYLLHLQGITVGTEADTIKPSQKLLMETLGWREAIEEVGTSLQLKQLKSELDTMHTATLDAIAAHFAVRDWNAITQDTLKLAYLIKAQEALKTRKVSE